MKTRAVLVSFVLFVTVASFAADKDEPSKASYWMQKKLEYSERILSGLVTKDFGQVAKNAQSMSALSRIEKWVHGNTREYRAQLQVFEDANDQLVRTAKDENLDGAALAYVQLSLSCINCHKIVRDRQRPAPVPTK